MLLAFITISPRFRRFELQRILRWKDTWVHFISLKFLALHVVRPTLPDMQGLYIIIYQCSMSCYGAFYCIYVSVCLGFAFK